MFHLKKCERDLGICAALLCPHCQQASNYKLHQQAASLCIAGIPLFDIDRSCFLACTGCKFRADLNPGELSAARRAKELYLKLESQELAPQQYLEKLEALDFPTLRKLRENAVTWSCSGCQEKVPANFDTCWNCGTGKPDAKDAPPTESFDPSVLPKGVTRRSPNPWE